MEKVKYKNTAKWFRLSLFKVALFFSVFAFSGYNVHVPDIVHYAVQTELVESKVCQPVFHQQSNLNLIDKASLAGPRPVFNLFHSYSFRNLNERVGVQIKAYQKKTSFYITTLDKVFFKMPTSSSEDENSSFFLT